MLQPSNIPQHAEGATARRRLTVRGIVQGVGFRPFVYALAHRLGLSGFVGNDSRGVFIEIEGPHPALDAFQSALLGEAPPLAHIHAVQCDALPPRGESGFTIVTSRSIAGSSTLVSPDLTVCDDCLRELYDPADRRYLYPFINCTNCGPRFTIIRDIPYDRPSTTMAGFRLCPPCAREYHDPLNRRYHAQPIACPDCGPHVWLEWTGHQAECYRGEALEGAREALRGGAILAVKGLGGFHLACDARSEAAVAALRLRKGRGEKPFAIMVKDATAAAQVARLSADETLRLTSRERPIVLLKKQGGNLADALAPGNDSVGVMLPYTPLHYLLLEDMPLVMTSGNVSGEPIETDTDLARARLAPLVDGFLMHDRPIHVPCDDSVIRVRGGADLPIRRSRGFAPLPVQLPFSLPPLLAVGGELKSTVCLARADQAILSQHIGDMENLETLEAFARVVEHLQTLFRVRPERVVCDMHPGYFSSRWARDYARARDIPLLEVQHHHAHIAAVMAEHGLDGTRPVLGVAFDGTGYGEDGAIWGGELLIADYSGYRRAAHLRYAPLPGGDAAVRHPYRSALAHLWTSGIRWDDDLPPVAAATDADRRVLRRQFETGLRCTPTSSMGRLFDAAAALIGLRPTVSFEAQAAMEFESLCSMPEAQDDRPGAGYRFAIGNGAESQPLIVDPAPVLSAMIADLRSNVPRPPLIVDPAPVLSAMIADLRSNVPKPRIALHFHRAIAAMVVDLGVRLRAQEGLDVVALSGGVFQNTRLLAMTTEACVDAGFTVLSHHLVPPNDGGLALGQAVLGGSRPAD